jgi:DNA repair protein RadA/Sms
MQTTVKRGRPSFNSTKFTSFNPNIIKICTGNDLDFDERMFIPNKTNREIDLLLSSDGGLMPAVNMMLTGGPGAGKTTVALDILSDLVKQGKNCLFISAEMDQIGYFKYCRRMPKIKNIPTLFLKDYISNCKEIMEHCLKSGYDVIVIDSVAEVLQMIKNEYKMTETLAETWLINLQDQVKKGNNSANVYTSFINIQQVTKSGDFAGSNRLKHMMDSYCNIKRDKDSTERTLAFDKNRDNDIVQNICFVIGEGGVRWMYEMTK